MKRFYPELNEANQSFFVSPAEVAPSKFDGVVSPLLRFDKFIPLQGDNPKPYSLSHKVDVVAVYIKTKEKGIVPVYVSRFIKTASVLKRERHHAVVLTGHCKCDILSIDGAKITLSLIGAINLAHSVVDMEVSLIDYTGLTAEPEIVGYDFEVFEADE